MTVITEERQTEIIEKLKGFKQTFLAQKLGLSYGHWMYITKNKRPLTEKHVKELKRLKYI